MSGGERRTRDDEGEDRGGSKLWGIYGSLVERDGEIYRRKRIRWTRRKMIHEHGMYRRREG